MRAEACHQKQGTQDIKQHPHHSGNISTEIITTRPFLPSVQTGSSRKIIFCIKTLYMKYAILLMQVLLKSLQRDHGMAVVNTF